MEEFRYDTYCGLYCGACEIMKAYRENKGTPASQWEDLPKPMRENIAKAEIVCRGCKTDVLFAGCQRCRIRKCAKERGVAACIVCEEYPCKIVKGTMEHISKGREQLPHTKVMFKNLDAVKTGGVGLWLKEQRSKWQCRQCGAAISWYQSSCERCGCELESQKDYNNY